MIRLSSGSFLPFGDFLSSPFAHAMRNGARSEAPAMAPSEPASAKRRRPRRLTAKPSCSVRSWRSIALLLRLAVEPELGGVHEGPQQVLVDVGVLAALVDELE